MTFLSDQRSRNKAVRVSVVRHQYLLRQKGIREFKDGMDKVGAVACAFWLSGEQRGLDDSV